MGPYNKETSLSNIAAIVIQTCKFDQTQNVKECEKKKSEYTENNLILTTKLELLYRNLYQNQSQTISEFGVRLSLHFRIKNLNDSDKI